MGLKPGDDVYFLVRSRAPYITWSAEMELRGRVLRVNPDGTVTVRSASGLITETVTADRVRLAETEETR